MDGAVVDNRGQPDRFGELKPKLSVFLRVAGAALLAVVAVVLASYGNDAPLKLGYSGRLAIGILGLLALVVFAASGAILAGEWLLNRYSDTRRRVR
jgi:hypothetical protein